MNVIIDVENRVKCPYRLYLGCSHKDGDGMLCITKDDNFPEGCPLVALAKKQELVTES
jgi:hypothetical protein